LISTATPSACAAGSSESAACGALTGLFHVPLEHARDVLGAGFVEAGQHIDMNRHRLIIARSGRSGNVFIRAFIAAHYLVFILFISICFLFLRI
jgi:hypothetical protein